MLPAVRAQVARARKAGLAETDDHRGGGFGRARVVHRSFSVARPVSTSSSEMIQNRTMTFGSAQPFSSK